MMFVIGSYSKHPTVYIHGSQYLLIGKYMPDYPVYAKLSNQKLSQLAVDPVEIDPEIKSFPFSYINPAWDYAKIFAMLMELQHQIAMTMAFTTSQEVATPHSHANLGMRLEYLATTLRSIQDKLNQPG